VAARPLQALLPRTWLTLLSAAQEAGGFHGKIYGIKVWKGEPSRPPQACAARDASARCPCITASAARRGLLLCCTCAAASLRGAQCRPARRQGSIGDVKAAERAAYPCCWALGSSPIRHRASQQLGLPSPPPCWPLC
jgi:hypothetical protein